VLVVPALAPDRVDRAGRTGGLSVRFAFGWKPGIDGFVRVGADLEIGAVMVAVVAIFISAMGSHELDHLQGAFRAIDVRNLDVGLLFLIERRDVHEQAVGKNRR
jgi:hypothetical protein